MDQQQPSVYPHFPISDGGIGKLHQELGRLMQLAWEREINLDKLLAEREQGAERLEQLGAEYQRLSDASRAFAEAHAPGKCCPVSETESEPRPEASREHLEPTPILRGGPGVPGCLACAASNAESGS